ncbi:hypothetical protein [Acidocella sp.]|jgi:hypothetical protein|uniref:hypothetical protein n=1 Tax=Acidocella sp. TaxID=50710 RepID=UPI002D7FB34A|nr:hypothetical protein [Acidocella sp.]
MVVELELRGRNEVLAAKSCAAQGRFRADLWDQVEKESIGFSSSMDSSPDQAS